MTNLTEKSLSAVLLAQRVIAASAFVFLATGEALHINAFIQNGLDIGLPYAAQICPAVVILTILGSAAFAIGFCTKTAAAALTAAVLFSGFFFFAGMVNKVNLVGTLLALAILIPFIITGAGKYSLDYYLRRKKLSGDKRISFR